MINQTANINDVLKTIQSFSIEEQTYIVDVINHRLHELKRNQLISRAKEAEQNYLQGNVQTGNVNDLFTALSDD